MNRIMSLLALAVVMILSTYSPASAANFFEDSYSVDASGTDLTAHVPTTIAGNTAQTGLSWAKNGAYNTIGDSLLIDNQSNPGTYQNSTTTTLYVGLGATPSSADYDVQTDFQMLTAAGRAGVAIRADTTVDTFYAFQYNHDTSQYNMVKHVSGVGNAFLASTPITLTPLALNTMYTIKISARGSTITGYIIRKSDGFYYNGSTFVSTTPIALVTATDSAITAAGHPGLYGPAAAYTTTTAVHYDNFQATNVSAPALAGGTITASSTTSTSITPTESAITGGTSPYSTVFSYSTTTNGTYTQIGTAVVGATPTATTAATGLTTGTTYYFRAVTTDSAGTPATVTMPSATTGTPLATSSAATGYTSSLSASSGTVGNPVTITYTGNGTTTATVTPAVSGVAGAFSPITIALNGTSPVTVTFTPSSAGTATLTSTNGGGLTDPASLTYTSSTGPVTIQPNNAAIFWSEQNWVVSSSLAYAANSGPYFKFNFTGTTLQASVDGSQLGSATVTAVFWVDNGASVSKSFTSSTTGLQSLFTGLSAGSHSVFGYLKDVTNTGSDRWGSASVIPTSALRIQSFQIDSGATVSASTLRAKRALFYWDSIGEGYRQDGNALADGLRSACPPIALALNAEYSPACYGGSAWSAAGNVGNVPALFTPGTPTSSYWDKFDGITGDTRLTGGVFTKPVDYIFALHGTNDIARGGSLATVAASVSGWLTAVRTAAPSAKIFVCIPMNQAVIGDYATNGIPGGVIASRGALTAIYTAGTVTAYKCASDSNAFLIDCGSDMAAGFSLTGGSTTFASFDQIHPYEFKSSEYATKIIQAVHACLNQGITFGRRPIQ